MCEESSQSSSWDEMAESLAHSQHQADLEAESLDEIELDSLQDSVWWAQWLRSHAATEGLKRVDTGVVSILSACTGSFAEATVLKERQCSTCVLRLSD